MFLTKQGLRKILIMAICLFLLGSITIAFWFLFRSVNVSDNHLLILGLILYLLCVPFVFLEWYSEGKGRLINLGNRLVRKELKPADFIKYYEYYKSSNDLIVKKPSVEILLLVATAYDLLNDRENALSTVEEMIIASSDKKKNFSNLIKCSFLFSYDRTEEAEQLYNQVKTKKLDLMCNSLVDVILKSDRAMAMGDYKTVEAHSIKMLERSFPKLDNMGKLVVHYRLGEVYEKLQDNSKAIAHFEYCASYGGETAIRKSAIEKLQTK